MRVGGLGMLLQIDDKRQQWWAKIVMHEWTDGVRGSRWDSRTM